jgi:hypothetical protein
MMKMMMMIHKNPGIFIKKMGRGRDELYLMPNDDLIENVC